MMRAFDAIGHALAVAGSMTWQITWSLILGFTLSAVVQEVVRRQTIARLLGNDRPKALALALAVTEDQVSYALKMLRLAGLVGFRKDGRMSFYRLSGGFPHQLLEHCLRQLLTIASPEADHAGT